MVSGFTGCHFRSCIETVEKIRTVGLKKQTTITTTKTSAGLVEVDVGLGVAKSVAE